jgi:hypothetical protein
MEHTQSVQCCCQGWRESGGVAANEAVHWNVCTGPPKMCPPATAQCRCCSKTHVHRVTRLARWTSQMGAPATCRPVQGSSPSASWAAPGQRP